MWRDVWYTPAGNLVMQQATHKQEQQYTRKNIRLKFQSNKMALRQ